MRTTLDIEVDVLRAAKELAGSQGVSIGKAISDLARKGLKGPNVETLKVRNGIPVLPSTGEIVTSEDVRRLMELEK